MDNLQIAEGIPERSYSGKLYRGAKTETETAKFILKSEFSLCVYLETFQERRLGFPKRAYFLKFVEMMTRGEPLKKETQF